VSHSETKPLNGGRAEIAAEPIRKAKAVWHAMDQAAELLHVPLAGGRQHRAGAVEQQALEHAVVEDVEQRGGEAERGGGRHGIRFEGQREPQPDEDDADVLHRVVGQQPLEIVLHQGMQDTEHGRHPAQQNHQGAPPPERWTEQVEHDARETVDGDLGHDAAHQRGYMAWRRGVGKGQPHMQRHEPRLGARADQHQHQHHRRDSRRGRRLTDRLELVSARRTGEQAEGEEQGERAEARHQQVQIARRGVARPAVMRHHQRPGGERHELP